MAGIDVDILIMPDLCSQTYFDPANEGFGTLGWSKTAPPVACWLAVLGPEVRHSDIYSRWDRRTQHHRHCRNLTVGVSLSLAADCLDLGLLEVRIVLEAHGHTDADRSRGKTSWRSHELADNQVNQMYVDLSLCIWPRLRT
jgi:hypothetical protein